MRTPKNLTILKHHRSADVYIDGRYLHVVAKISLRSKRGREIARETVLTILEAIKKAEDTHQLRRQPVIIGHEQSTGRPIYQGDPSSSMEGSSTGVS